MKVSGIIVAVWLSGIWIHAHAQQVSFTPGKVWPDEQGQHINAHGGGVLFHQGKYYWFGEHKGEGKRGNAAWEGVRCYSSADLYNWKNEGIVLPVVEDLSSEITKGCVIERPKVMYNKKTKQFVMWFHLELKGRGYTAARTAVAVSNNVLGPYQYLRSYRPNANTWPLYFKETWKQRKITEASLEAWSDEWQKEVAKGLFIRRDHKEGQMARDMTLFVDDDGKAYHIHASEENLTLHIAELTEDYLSFAGTWVTAMPAGHNEAPAILKKDEKYFLITSGCTGWSPNAARSFVAPSVLGPWTALGNPCEGAGAALTFNAQGTYILPVHGLKDGYIFMADRWAPQNPIEGKYVWLPLVFVNGRPVLRWHDAWKLEDFSVLQNQE